MSDWSSDVCSSDLALPAPKGSGKICLNGPPAHLFQPGDQVIILSMGMFDEDELDQLSPTVVFVDSTNAITKVEKHDRVVAKFR